METDKNLFLFFPYNMYFVDEGGFEDGLYIALTGISNDFKTSLQYRSAIHPNRDTYFCFVYARHFVISIWNNESLNLLDTIPVEKSPLFIELLGYVDTTFTGDVLK